MTCSGPSATQCYSCESSLYFYPNGSSRSCLTNCPSSTYIVGEGDPSQICFNCDPSCATCSGGSTSECLSCPSTTYLDTSHSCVSSCQNGQYGDPSSGTCKTCPTGCQTCASGTQCLICSNGWIKNSSSGLCVQSCGNSQFNNTSLNECDNCDSSCLTCSGAGSNACTSCRSGLVLTSQAECLTSCPSHTYNHSGFCSSCDSSCLNCSGNSSNDCTSCNNGFFLTSQKNCVESCPSHTYNTSRYCRQCDSSCFNCSGEDSNECTSCNNGLALTSQGKCVESCPSHTYNSSGYCTQCDSSCLKCSGPGSTSCISCNNGLILTSQGVCVSSCPSHTYNNSGYCTGCDTSCLNCNGAGSSACTSCSNGLLLTNQGECVASCPTHSYNNSQFCSGCDSSCLNCSGNLNTECVSCYSGTYLRNDGRCQNTCPSGYYGDNSDLICKQCDSSCLTCSGPSNSQCLSCIQNENLINGQCECSLGFYLNQIDGCVSCPSNCSSCNAVNSCLTCKNGYTLMNGKCIACLNAQYLGTDGMCINCSGFCSTCLSDLVCLTCQQGYYLKNDNQCVNTCGDGLYGDSSDKKCKACAENCERCSDQNNCLSCVQGFNLQNLNCYSICDSSQYFDKNSLQCVNCYLSCLTCSGPSDNQCLSCPNGSVLNGSICVSSCSNNQYVDSSKVCGFCDNSCETCFDSTNSSCWSCGNSTFLLNNSCLGECPYGYTTNYTNRKCYKIISRPISVSIIDIDNPFKFLIVFNAQNLSNFTISVNKYLLQELIINPKIEISNYTENFSYVINPSGINASCFILELTYNSHNPPTNISLLKLGFLNSNNPTFTFQTQNLSFKLLPYHQCQTNEYFDSISLLCLKKPQIDFTLDYGTENNEVLLFFSNLNDQIRFLLLQTPILVVSIQSFSEYTYSLKQNNPTTYQIAFQYQKDLVGGRILSVGLNSTIVDMVNIINKTAELLNSPKTIKLFDTYILSQLSQSSINSTTAMVKYGSQCSDVAAYTSILLSPGSSFAVRGLLMLTIIKLLRYVDIAYPPNVVSLFKNDDGKKITFQDDIMQTPSGEKTKDMPPLLVIYKVSGSIVNNLSEDFFILVLILLMAGIVATLLAAHLKVRLMEVVVKLFKSIFIWSMTIMIMLSKYIKISLYLFIFIRFNLSSDYDELDWYDLIVGLFCFLYVVLFPLHLFFITKKILQTNDNNSPTKILFKTQLSLKRVYPLSIVTATSDKEKEKGSGISPFETLSQWGGISSDQTKIVEDHQKESESYQKPQNVKQNKVVPFQISTLDFDTFFATNSYKSVPKRNTLFPDAETEENSHRVLPNSTTKILPSSKTRPEPSYPIDQIVECDEENNKSPITTAKEEMKPIKLSNLEKHKTSIDVKMGKDVWSVYPLHDSNKIEKITQENIWKKYTNAVLAFFIRPLMFFKNYINGVYNPKDITDLSFRYRILVKGLSIIQNFNKFYFCFDLLRYFLLTLFVIMLIGYPIAQICLMVSVSLCFLGFLVIKKPFASRVDLGISITKELMINAAYGSALILAALDKEGNADKDLRMNLGWAIVLSYTALMYSLLLASLVKILRLLHFMLKLLILKLKK